MTATYEQFEAAAGGPAAAMAFEAQALSIGDEFLTPEARDVRDGRVQSPSPSYWGWLLTQLAQT